MAAQTQDWFSEQGAPQVLAPTVTSAFGTSMGSGPVPAGVYTNQNPPPASAGTRYSDDALQAILHKYPPTNDGMRAAMREVDQTFGAGTVKLLDHPERLDKLVLPDGRTIDTIGGAGGPNPSWTFNAEGGAHGGGGSTLGGLSGVGVTPQGMAFVNRVMGDMGAVGPLLGDPMAGRPITDDPSFGFRMNEGAKALERSAAANGTLLTGGAAKAMQRYAQDVASTEYQNSYNRRASEQQNNYNRLAGVADFMGGQQTNQFNRYYQTSNLGLNATNQAQNNASGYANNIGNAQIGQGNNAAWATGQNANAHADLYTGLGNIAGAAMTNWYNNKNGGVAGSGGTAGIGGAIQPNPYAGLPTGLGRTPNGYGIWER